MEPIVTTALREHIEDLLAPYRTLGWTRAIEWLAIPVRVRPESQVRGVLHGALNQFLGIFGFDRNQRLALPEPVQQMLELCCGHDAEERVLYAQTTCVHQEHTNNDLASHFCG